MYHVPPKMPWYEILGLSLVIWVLAAVIFALMIGRVASVKSRGNRFGR